MTLALAHVSVRSRNLAASLRFYTEVLGLATGPRPPFGFPGAWLYGREEDSSQGVIHLIGPGSEEYLGDRSSGSGALDHVAFTATGWPALRGRLEALNIKFNVRTVPQLGLRQVFLSDPDGIVIELNFPAGE